MFLFFPSGRSLPIRADGASSWPVKVQDASVVFSQLEGSFDKFENIPFCFDSFHFYYLTKIFRVYYTVLGRCDPDKCLTLSIRE